MAFNYANQESVGKVAHIDIWTDRNDKGYSCFRGVAEIKDVNADSVTIQWIDVRPGREDTLYSRTMYTEPSKVSRDAILKYYGEQGLDFNVMQRMRSDNMVRDMSVFRAYDQRMAERTAKAEAICPEESPKHDFEKDFL